MQARPAISPDSRWIAYESNESGRYEVHVRSAMAPTAGSTSSETWLVSSAGGSAPIWSPTGSELYYVSADYGIMAVSVERDAVGGFKAGLPARLFDGERFLFQVPDEELRDRTIEVVMNWERLLER